MPLGDAADDGESDARPLVCVAAVETLEDSEDAVEVLLVEAYAVVRDVYASELARRGFSADAPIARSHALAPDLHQRRLARLVELQCVAD